MTSHDCPECRNSQWRRHCPTPEPDAPRCGWMTCTRCGLNLNFATGSYFLGSTT